MIPSDDIITDGYETIADITDADRQTRRGTTQFFYPFVCKTLRTTKTLRYDHISIG